jgi:hypothetical protein
VILIPEHKEYHVRGTSVYKNETKASDLGRRERKEKATEASLNPPIC